MAPPWGLWHCPALHKEEEEEDGGRHGWETHGGVKSLVQEAVEKIWWPDPSWVMLLPSVEGGFGQGGAVSGPWSGHAQGD